MALVSVIIPAYRAEAHIARAVKSVLAQTFSDFEIVIISDDLQDYEAILKRQGVADNRIVFTQTGLVAGGISRARNTGLDAASAPIIALLDADDMFHPTKLERMYPKAVEYGMCVCAMDYIRFEGQEKILIERIGLGQESRLLAANDFLTIHYSANAMQLFDRNKVPLRWLEDIPAMEDIMFSVCAYGHIPSIYHVNEVLHDYVQTPNSFSTNADATKNFSAAKRIIIGQFERGEVSFLQERDRLAVLEYFTLSHSAEGLYAEEQAAGGLLSFTEIFSRLRQEKSTSLQPSAQ